jgi:PIN domain nuclease of toxin-antitoxin system
MRLLLDTHVLLWWLADDPELGEGARHAIAAAENTCIVSAATIWEIAIKSALGKLEVPAEIEGLLAHEGFSSLNVSAEHAWEVGRLPAVHRDPFDRMLVAQCRIEGLTLVTHDATLGRYSIPILQA